MGALDIVDLHTLKNAIVLNKNQEIQKNKQDPQCELRHGWE